MKLLAIDGNSIMNRAFYGIKMLSNKKGMFTNALTGFMNIYLKSVSEVKPDCAAVAFDLKAPTFRHKADASYKANRKGMPEELHMQMPVIKDILRAMGIAVLECEGFEADDILGTLARISEENGSSCFISTGDRDSLQLISDNVTVRLATTKETIIYDKERFTADYGFPPINLIDLKALMGDSSDNISGVPGIGEKTASALIGKYLTIENIYADLDAVECTRSVRTKLENGRSAAENSKFLATIVKNAPISENLSDYKIGSGDPEKLAQILTDMEMFKLLEKLSLKPSAAPAKKAENTEEKLISYKPADKFDFSGGFDFVFDAENIRLTAVSGDKIFVTDDKPQILDILSSDIPKGTFRAKSAYKFCLENGREMKNIVRDGDIMGYLLNASSAEYTVEKLCAEHGAHFYSEAGDNAEAASLPELNRRLYAEIASEGMEKLLLEIEQPLTEVLASMEFYGVKVDTDGIRSFGEKLTADIAGIADSIYFMAGKKFNISSPKQLGTVLFEDLGLPHGKKTKTGYSTNADVLEELADKHEIVSRVLEYRQLTKLNSTYVDGLLNAADDMGRVHSVFRQTETRTGRISSTEPNVQNIPVRTELGRNMRRFFIAEDGMTLLDADYSQIELRILASVCGDKNMQEAFLSGKDIHTSTAASVFGMPEDMISPEMRRTAKAVNFGIIYGIGAFSLGKDIGVSTKEAERYIKNYLDNFPGVSKYMNDTVEFAKANGYVKTEFGRRRYIPELSAANKNVQAFGKRAAMNAPIQGTAADVIKIAMVKVYKRLKKELPDARLILQVHDELIIEAYEKDAKAAAHILQEEMENAVSFAVPMSADVNEGRSWYDAKG